VLLSLRERKVASGRQTGVGSGRVDHIEHLRATHDKISLSDTPGEDGKWEVLTASCDPMRGKTTSKWHSILLIYVCFAVSSGPCATVDLSPLGSVFYSVFLQMYVKHVHISQWRQWGGGPPRVTPYREVTPERKKCEQIYKVLWTSEVGEVKKVRGDTLQGGGWHTSEINKKLTSDEQKRSSVFKEKGWHCRTGRRWWLKESSVFFQKKSGWHPQLLPRVTPTLVTPLHIFYPSFSGLSVFTTGPIDKSVGQSE